jgi:acyl-[acyl-carrier-protein]-phospholipid O-acyltransferase/long-chain-fatty-acid--[acyl-carrier-protein] ligase
MVPHEVVEQKAIDCLGLAGDSERSVAIVGVPDETKGEALVLLSTRDIEIQHLRQSLVNCGVPNLWVPRVVRRVDAIPVLSSGKLDLRRCRELAEVD